VRSALLSIDGVSRARVSLEEREAVVVYDPARVTVEQLRAAVKRAQGPSEYRAEVKRP
jgi:copper chaperone CopZ